MRTRAACPRKRSAVVSSLSILAAVPEVALIASQGSPHRRRPGPGRPSASGRASPTPTIQLSAALDVNAQGFDAVFATQITRRQPADGPPCSAPADAVGADAAQTSHSSANPEVTDRSESIMIRVSCVVTGHWSLVTGHWSLVALPGVRASRSTRGSIEPKTRGRARSHTPMTNDQ